MNLWLDDIRDPRHHGAIGFTWVKTAEEAIEVFATGEVEYASLDHDLSVDQMEKGGYHGLIWNDGILCGYDVVLWLEKNPQYLPPEGISVHSANPAGRKRMEELIYKLYVEKIDATKLSKEGSTVLRDHQ